MKLLADKGIWLSLQALDPAPPTAPESTRLKKAQVIDGTDNAFTWAKKYGVKLAWGTDFLFDPRQNARQAADILKLKQWFTPAEILKMVTHDNAQLLALSGPRNPYQAGKLGVVETGALRGPAARGWRPDRERRPDRRSGEELRRDHEGRQGLQEHAAVGTADRGSGSGFLRYPLSDH